MVNVIKRMWHISVRIGKGSRLGKMGREALEPRIGKCHKENVAYFSKDWEWAQIGVRIQGNDPRGLGTRKFKIS